MWQSADNKQTEGFAADRRQECCQGKIHPLAELLYMYVYIVNLYGGAGKHDGSDFLIWCHQTVAEAMPLQAAALHAGLSIPTVPNMPFPISFVVGMNSSSSILGCHGRRTVRKR